MSDHALHQGRLLIVDDDPGIRTFYAAVLNDGGYAVIEAETLLAAKEILETADRHPDTGIIGVLLDNRLPDGRGVDFVANLRADDRFETLPVLLITGDDEGINEAGALDAGSTDYLFKPVGPEVLLARVSAHLRKRATWLAKLERVRADTDTRPDMDEQLCELLETESFHSVFQPIVELTNRIVLGYEALTRFEDGTPPERIFDAAATAENGVELELVTMRAALRAADLLPEETYVCLNVSPRLLIEALPRLIDTIRASGRPIVLEITERQKISDYPAIIASIAALDPDVRLSVDDAGAGFASLRHVLKLRPDFVKLDREWVAGIERDLSRQALVAGLVYFSETTGCGLIAEGIESESERKMLSDLGVGLGQGYLLGVPSRP